jgi:hypothetical protein
MLEQQSLLVMPWSLVESLPPVADPEQVQLRQRQVIRDAITQASLGFVSKRPVTGHRWLRWLLPRQVLEVREFEDESLLFTMQRALSFILPWQSGRAERHGRWAVRDADDRAVGWLKCTCERESAGPVVTVQVRDQWGQALAVLPGWQPESAAPVKVIQPLAPPHLAEWATLSHQEEAIRVQFAPTLDGEPFAKMLVLAAVLAACTAGSTSSLLGPSGST